MFSLSFFMCSIFAAGILRSSALPATEGRVPGNDIEQTMTGRSTTRIPGWTIPRQNAHFVPEGGQVIASQKDGLIRVVASNGSVIHSTQLSKGRKINNPTDVSASEQPALSPRALDNGTVYAAFAYFNNTVPGASPIASTSTSWTVPPIPSTSDDQLLYYLSALASSDFDSFVEPVLQYGSSPAGGGSYWSVGSWYMVGNDVYYTSLTAVTPGQVLTSSMGLQNTLENASGHKTFSWSAEFTGIPGSKLSATSEQEFTYFYEALQLFNVSRISDLPASTSKTELRNITIRNQDGQFPFVNWTIGFDEDDGFNMTIVPTAGNQTQGGDGNDGGLDIGYPTQ